MLDLLIRLYRVKLTLVAIVFIAVGSYLMYVDQAVGSGMHSGWLQQVPFGGIGDSLLISGLFGVLLYFLDHDDAEARADQRLARVLKRAAPAIRDSVLDGFASNPEALRQLASPELLDRIATNALGLRLGDQVLAGEVYTDLRNQIIRASERWRDVHVSVALPPWNEAPATADDPMFVATVHWEYRVTPGSPTMHIACVSDLAESRELLQDHARPAVWYFEPVGKLTASTPGVFELVWVTVNGQERSTRRSNRTGAVNYSVSLEREHLAGQEITLAYTYRVLVQQASHLLYFDVPRPARGFHVQLWYGDTGIRYVNVLDLIASAEQPRVLQTPASAPSPSIDIGFDGWVLPRAGVAFVWVLEGEVGSFAARSSASPPWLPALPE